MDTAAATQAVADAQAQVRHRLEEIWPTAAARDFERLESFLGVRGAVAGPALRCELRQLALRQGSGFQILPSKSRTTRITTSKPSPPLG